MVIFKVSENINIKTTDGTIVKYNKIKNPSNFFNETLYVSTYEDFEDLKKVFLNVGNKYKARVIDEKNIRSLSQFPKELGISNENEYTITNNLNFKYKKNILKEEKEINSLYLNELKVDINKQIKNTLKQDISIIILGKPGSSISEMICASTALRILYEKLKEKFKTVKIDLFINASENTYFTRDKMILLNQSFINEVSALSVDIKTFCEYDFFIDLSSIKKRSFYKYLNYIDGYLYKFGIDYKKVDKSLKYNSINISSYKAKKDLKDKIDEIKLKGKILLFHPYSARITKSIPKETSLRVLKELLLKLPDYTIVSVLKIDPKLNDDRYVDLSSYSKTFMDFTYIVSNMNKVVTVDTATYHMADAFFIPSVVIISNNNENNICEYPLSKMIYVEDKSKNFSHFVFENDALVLNKFVGWNELKSEKIIKLLESF